MKTQVTYDCHDMEAAVKELFVMNMLWIDFDDEMIGTDSIVPLFAKFVAGLCRYSCMTLFGDVQLSPGHRSFGVPNNPATSQHQRMSESFNNPTYFTSPPGNRCSNICLSLPKAMPPETPPHFSTVTVLSVTVPAISNMKPMPMEAVKVLSFQVTLSL